MGRVGGGGPGQTRSGANRLGPGRCMPYVDGGRPGQMELRKGSAGPMSTRSETGVVESVQVMPKTDKEGPRWQ